MSNKTADKIAALEREIQKLKGERPPTPQEAEAERKRVAEYANEVHQMREKAANAFRFSPAVQREMSRACSDADLHDLARHGTVQSQSQIGVRNQGSGVRSGGGTNIPRGTGWVESEPLGPQPGIRYVDAQLDAQDRRDKAERIPREAQVRATQKAARP